MGGKAKPTKHSAAEIKAKTAAALTNKGGGQAGLADRKGGAVGHSRYKCPVCAMAVPDLKTAEIHWNARHDKLPYAPDAFSNLHELTGGVTTAGVAVRGSVKAQHH